MHTTLKKYQAGFSLIEVILYMGLASLFVSSAIIFGWNIIYGGEKSAVQREVNQNLRLVSKRVEYEIKNASSVLSVSANSLCLASATAAHNPTRIYLSSGSVRVAWGGGSTNCTSMINDQPLTGQSVVVSSLVFTDRSSGVVSSHIGFNLTISSQGARQEWQKTASYAGSAEVRTD
jgi:hypothetical protein